MNCFASATRRDGMKWNAMVRYVHQGDFWPIMDGENAKQFGSQQDALVAAQSAVIRYANSTMRRSGERVTAAHKNAEAIFVKGRKIEVEIRNG